MKNKGILALLCDMVLVISGLAVFAAKFSIKNAREWGAKIAGIKRSEGYVASVNSVKILNSTFDARMFDYESALYTSEDVKTKPSDDEVKAYIIDELINDEILRRECEKFGLTVSVEEAQKQKNYEFLVIDKQLNSDDPADRVNAQKV